MSIKKTVSFIILFIYLFSMYSPMVVTAVTRVDCEYEELNLTLSYDLAENSNPTINSDFVSSEEYLNLIIFKTGSDITRTDKIILDQTLYKKYTGGYVCPDKMYVCTRTNYSINFPTIAGLGAQATLFLLQLCDLVLELGDWVIDSIETIANWIPLVEVDWGNDLSSIITAEFKDIVEEDAWALVTFDERTLYILTESEYKKNDISDYSTRLYNDVVDYHNKNISLLCENGKCSTWYWDILNILLADIKVAWDVLVSLIVDDGVVLLGYEEINCMTVDYTGEYGKVDINCSFLQTATFEYQDLIKKYKDCSDDSCKSSIIGEIKRKEKRINAACDNVLANYYYSETQKECVKRCLYLDKELNELKKGTDLYNDGLEIVGPNQCSLSHRVVNWLMKVVRWIRYLVPIILIILSIIDFIKAVASDSDDEIKKVGGKFVKRLIVAALVFLIPLILEYVLGIFDIGTNDYCL